ncbi:MAG: glycosyltransferase [Pseudomonadota bacterium]
MKILFVCHRMPYPPRRGGKIRPFNIIRHLAEQGHRVTIVSMARTGEEADAGAGLAEHCEEVVVETVGSAGPWFRTLSRLFTMTPSSMGYFYSPALHKRVRERLASRRYDLIFVHCSSVAQYVSDVSDVPKIIDFGDMDSQKWLAYSRHRAFPLSLGYWLEGRKLARAERRGRRCVA